MLDVPSENLPQKAHGNVVLHSVSHTLAYADIFDYPLTASEVYRYLGAPDASFEDVLEALAHQDLFTQVGDYFTIRGRERIVETRKQRYQIAARLWKKAMRYGRLIAQIPFMRMVAVTGSLAMNNTDEGNDIDYLLVTAPGHLWTCRAFSLLLARFAKLEGVSLCPNYLLTENALRLEEQSLYVAHELVQMVPISGQGVYAKMLHLNGWITDYLPNATMHAEGASPDQPLGIQRILEAFFRLPPARWFETWEMKRKVKRLTREQSSSPESYFSADVCKGHIDKHGQKVAMTLAVRLQRTSEKATEATTEAI